MSVYLTVSKICKSFGSFQALKEASFSVNEGELVCILGPSGCGKTTLLRVIAGLEEQNSGEIVQKGVTISNLPPDQRDFGIVFQSYALFPNLTIKKNIIFGLQTRNQSSEIIENRLNELLSLIGLESHKNKYPAQLSGGEQQRVALARALAPSPGLLLLDEPLSALDAKVRQFLRLEIKNLQKKLGVTTIMVTHDQEEALSMADRIILMNKGVIEQIGTPQELYSKPETSFTADFIGKTNLISAKKISENKIKMFGQEFDCSEPLMSEEITVAIRPEDIKISKQLSEPNIIQGRVLEIEFLGSYSIGQIEVQYNDQKEILICHLPIDNNEQSSIAKNSQISFSLNPNSLKIVSS
ncbi:MAG: putative 2-aminoethylphosphonate ABC transporter ATP-binding protein [Alphaproteobacteria bacterium]|jgi:iron(III) transport system ATP-binding protein